METINSVIQVMLIFQTLCLLSFIKKCSKNVNFIESNKVRKSGIQTTSHQEGKKKCQHFKCERTLHFAKIPFSFHPPRHLPSCSEAFWKLNAISQNPSSTAGIQWVEPEQLILSKWVLESIFQLPTALPARASALWLLKTLVSQLRHLKEPERADFSCALCSSESFYRNILECCRKICTHSSSSVSAC